MHVTGKQSVNIVSFTVEGRGDFPFDMLRYDNAWPRTEDDSIDLVKGSAYRDSPKRTVDLQGIGRPTTERWDSFGWKVVEEESNPSTPRPLGSRSVHVAEFGGDDV